MTDYVFTIAELTNYIKTIVGGKKVLVIGEVSQPKLSGGHLYFSIKDDSTNIKCIIWKSKNINKDNIKEGNKVTLECKLDFYGGTGNVNLIVDKLIISEGQGDLFIKYEKIKNDFQEKGYFDQSHKKQLPKILKNILIITSENGAALQDFIHNLNNYSSNINYDIVDVMVQGVDCPKNICNILTELKQNNTIYDLVVITRGGGSFEDLFGFSQPELIDTVYNFHLPVLSAIGHKTDNPLLDLVADVNTPTPSLAAQFIVDHNKSFIKEIESIHNNIKNNLFEEITKRLKLLTRLNDQINTIINSFTTDIKNDCKIHLQKYIQQRLNRLSQLESQLIINENKTISLYQNNILIESPEELEKFLNQSLKLRWGQKEFKIKLI